MNREGRLAHSSLAQLTLARVREFLREPDAVFWTFAFPLLLAAGLGIAFRNRPPETPRIAVVAEHDAAGIGERLAAAGLLVRILPDTAAARELRTGRVALVVQPLAGGGVEYRYDQTRADARGARFLADDAVQRGAGRTDPVPIEDRLVSERGSRYIDFLLPGLLGMTIMGSGVWGVGWVIVEARRRKLLKRLAATPMSRSEFLGSFLLMRLVLLVLEMVVLLGFGAWAFGVPVRGSFAQLMLITVFAALSFSALGLLVASRVRTTEGVQGLMNLVMLPMWVFSGVFFSATNFPDVMQPLVQALPLTALNDALRANMLEAADWSEIVPELGILAVWLVVSFTAALKLFRWR
ncbi:MAG TPA: ABC transporter permease [Gemmatimonadaceae bacterium]|nr:ABC transporter permease [Gemmatimonadaceae bacterium]